MVKKYSKIIMLALIVAMVFSCAAFAAPKKAIKKAAKKAAFQTVYLKSPNWEPNAKKVLNDMMDMYGKASPKYDAKNKPYTVFDCDNSITILDVEEQLAIYQLEHLRFAIRPDQMYDILVTGVPDVNKDLGKDYDHKTVKVIAEDAAAAYKKLFDKGYVAVDNSKEAKMKEWMATDDWKEFATKSRWLYDAICDVFDAAVGYPWITYWFAGMTPAQVERLAAESHTYYSKRAEADAAFWQKCKWTSPKDYPGSKGGQITIGFNQGVTVSPELKELIAALDANGIDMWINSASYLDVIKAVPGVFGLKGVEGVVAMTNVVKDGVITNEYDYAFHPQTQGVGKSETIDKIIRPKYKGRGPILGVMDSQGDFNFCSEYKDTAVVLDLNRARKDDAGLIAAIALWQDKHGITLKKALAMGDTRYVLQGRNENGGKLWAKNTCLRLGKDKEELLSSKAEKWLEMLEKGTTPKQLLNDCTKLTGKLKKYIGYKVR